MTIHIWPVDKLNRRNCYVMMMPLGEKNEMKSFWAKVRKNEDFFLSCLFGRFIIEKLLCWVLYWQLTWLDKNHVTVTYQKCTLDWEKTLFFCWKWTDKRKQVEMVEWACKIFSVRKTRRILFVFMAILLYVLVLNEWMNFTHKHNRRKRKGNGWPVKKCECERKKWKKEKKDSP